MKISYLSSAAAVLALALTQTSGAGTLNVNGTSCGNITGVTITGFGDMTVSSSASCTSGGPPPSGAPACSLSTTAGFISATITAGQTAPLNASCNSSPTSYKWTGGPPTPTSSEASATLTFSNAGTFNYTVAGVNSSGTGTASNTVTINVAAASTGGGDPTCPAPPLAITEVAQSLGTKKPYTYGTNQGRAVRFTAGNNSFGSVGWIIPSGTTPVSQLVSISRCPGDFTKTYPCGSTGTQNTLWTTNGAAASYLCPLTAGQVYYVNVRNGISTAGSGVTVELK